MPPNSRGHEGAHADVTAGVAVIAARECRAEDPERRTNRDADEEAVPDRIAGTLDASELIREDLTILEAVRDDNRVARERLDGADALAPGAIDDEHRIARFDLARELIEGRPGRRRRRAAGA